jgi:thiol-disulfide isomerase/thioredoxin
MRASRFLQLSSWTAAVAAGSGKAPPGTKETSNFVVPELDTSAFLDMASKEMSVIEFYAPWCVPCQDLEAGYKQAAQQLAALDPPVAMARIDAEQYPAIAARFNVSAYPDVRVFRALKDYHVPVPVYFPPQNLLQHLQYQIDGGSPPVEVRSLEELEALSKQTFQGEEASAAVVILGIFPASARGSDASSEGEGEDGGQPREAAEAGSVELQLWKDLAYELRSTQHGYTLAYSFSGEVRQKYGRSPMLSNGTATVLLASTLRLNKKESARQHERNRAATAGKAPTGDPSVAVISSGWLPPHKQGHPRLDLTALVLAHTSLVSTESKDMTHHPDDNQPLHPSMRASRRAVYNAAVAKRRLVRL